MPGFCYVIIDIVRIFVMALDIAMLLRAVISWIPGADENILSDFLYTVTEPIIVPVRMLFEKFGWFEDSPLDVPFFIAGLLLTGILYVLSI